MQYQPRFQGYPPRGWTHGTPPGVHQADMWRPTPYMQQHMAVRPMQGIMPPRGGGMGWHDPGFAPGAGDGRFFVTPPFDPGFAPDRGQPYQQQYPSYSNEQFFGYPGTGYPSRPQMAFGNTVGNSGG